MTDSSIPEPAPTAWPLLQRIRLGLLLAALAVGAVGVSRDDRRIVWVAIGFAVVGTLLRFLRRP